MLCMQIRGEASTPDSLDRARVIDKLRGFSKQLDGILPYLSLAVSAVGLLNQGLSALPACSCSMSRDVPDVAVRCVT